MCACRGGDEMLTCEVHFRKVLEAAGKRWGLDKTIREALQIDHSAPSQPSLFPQKQKDPVASVVGERHAEGVKDLIKTFCRLWREIRGGEYVPAWGRDGAAVKRLLKATGASHAEVAKRMRIALHDPWFQRAGNLAAFCSRWSNYDRPLDGNGKLSPPSGETKRVVGIDASTGALRYA